MKFYVILEIGLVEVRLVSYLSSNHKVKSSLPCRRCWHTNIPFSHVATSVISQVCRSTDGVWCCLTCGHVGCGRRAHLPELGGGHSRHHFQTAHGTTGETPPQRRKRRRSSTRRDHHAVCIDVVSKAVHCYICDDYVLSDAPWLERLRSELETLETVDVDMLNPSDSMDESEDFHSNRLLPTPGRTGLHNLGNTCYMNSVLQMLSHCAGFRSFFCDFLRAAAPLKLGENAIIARKQSILLKNDVQEKSKTQDRLALTEATHALLRVLWNGKWRAVSPHAFVQAVWTHGGIFAARRQQDAQEFLGFVLNRLDEEINPSKNRNTISPILKDLFGFEINQEVKCDGCHTITRRSETMLGLVLSLPESEGRRRSNRQTVTLQSCLDTLQSTERLEGDNQFFCDTCHAKKDATKYVVFKHFPQAMLISFRRTCWNAKQGLHKDGRRVIFPLELDATSVLGGDSSSTTEKNIGSEPNNLMYRLSSVVSHYGSSPFLGHYLVWCKDSGTYANENAGEKNNNDRWHLYNDATVTEASDDDVLQAEAFILLYERQSL